MKKIAIFLFFLLIPSIAFAQEESVKPQDLFEFAPDVRIEAPASRDVVVVGGKVQITENVAQDLFAAGGTIEITGDVGDDIRVAGTRVIINSRINGNAAILAGTVEIGPNAVISGSARIKAETVVLNGTISQDAIIDAVDFQQNGTISGELIYKKIEKREPSKNAFSWFFRLIGLFGMLIVGLIMVNIWPKLIKHATQRSMKNPTKDFLYGIIGLIATPLVVIVLMLTLIGFPLGIILLTAYLIALYFAQIFTGIILGTYLFGAFKGREQAKKSSLLAILVVGVIVLWLITGLPYVGALIKLISIIWGLGILAVMKIESIKKLAE